MKKVKILSDSTCDLSQELIAEYEIGILPLYVNLGGQVYKDNGTDITPKIIYDYVDKTGVLPGTIAVSVDDFKTEFEKWRNDGYEVVCHTISSDMSCSFQNAKIAADGMDGVEIVDTRSLSTGVGLLVLNSAELADKGLNAAQIAENSRALTSNVSATFILDSLSYMKKGGRCSMVTALGANLLRIKPMIAVDNGNMKVVHKFKGLFSKVLLDYVDLQLGGIKDVRTNRIFITHTGCSPEIVDLVRERIKKHVNFDNITETTAGATVTSHSGPNTLGILYLKA